MEKHNAIEKAMIILKLFDPSNQELGTVEISRLLGYHKATVSRTLLLLAKHRFLEQNPENRKFKLGPAVLSLGMALSRSLKEDIVHIAKPHMDALRDRFEESVLLEVLSTKYVVIAHISEGPKRIRLAGEIGDLVPAYVAAGAKSIMAFSPPQVRERLLDHNMERLTPKTITDPTMLNEQIEEIRRKGYATDRGEHDIDVHAIAAPVLNNESVPVGAIVMAGLARHIQSDEDSEMVIAVKETAMTISKQLYYSYQ